MIINLTRKKIYVANVKVASTAIESVLQQDADVRLLRAEHGKHLTLTEVQQRFSFLFRPHGIAAFDVFGSIRHPLRWLISIYESHLAEQFAGTEISSRGLTFEEYIVGRLHRGWEQLAPQLSRFAYADGTIAPVKWIPLSGTAAFLEEQWFEGQARVQLPLRNVSFGRGRERIRCSQRRLRVLASFYMHDIEAYLAHQQPDESFTGDVESAFQFLRSSLDAINESSASPPAEALTDWQIVQCYRALLGRDPESSDVIAHHRSFGTLHGALQAITSSEEYRRRHDQTGVPQP